MRILKKLLLINWHYIGHELLEFGMINFLTGKTGVGKSTIVDALQLLLLGDTTGTFFNKAANPNSRRTLRGYLRGEVDDSEEQGLIYRRQGDFSSYIVAEFLDTEKNQPFCLGVVFDSYADDSYKHMFFHFNDTIPANHFILDQVPMNIKLLKEWLMRQYGRGCTEETNKGFQEVLRARLGNLNEKFFRLFRKAVPFNPDLDVRGFIAEFVVDAQNKVDIQDMRENIRYYKQMEQEAELVKQRCSALDGIAARYGAYQEEIQRLLVQRYLMDRAEEEEARREIVALLERVEAGRRDLERMGERLAQLDGQIRETKEENNRLREERAHSDTARKLNDLTARKRALEEKAEAAQRAGERFRRTLETYLVPWHNAGDVTGLPVAALAAKGEEQAFRREAAELLAQTAGLRGVLERGEYLAIDEEGLAKWRRSMAAVTRYLEEEFLEVRNETSRLKAEASRLEEEIRGLKAGIKPYSPKLLQLQEAIAAELSARHGRRIQPRIFCELLDIKEPRWRNAIEGYLHTQRFYLLIEPEYFVEALRVYDRLKFEQEFYDLGLVDTGKIMEQAPRVLPGSLAEEIVTADSYARAYADYLLGQVMKVEQVEDLRQYRTAITPTCMLYQNFVARQLNPSRYRTPYIGQRAIEEQIRQKSGELAEARERLSRLEPLGGRLDNLRQKPRLTEEGLHAALEDREPYRDLPRWRQELDQTIAELGSLDLFSLQRLDARIRELEDQEGRLRTAWGELYGQRGGLAAKLEEMAQTQIPGAEERARACRERLQGGYEAAWVDQYGEPRFLQELQARGTPQDIRSAFAAQVERTRSQSEKKWNDLVGARSQYNREFRGSFEIFAQNNGEFEAEADRLRQTLLPEYEAKIADARDKAQVQFQEDFISKLRDNMENVEAQIDELNQALAVVPFGRDRYRFKCSPNPQYREFYQMIKDEMLVEGYNLFSPKFQEKYRDTIDRLFAQIVTTGEGVLTAEQQAELQRNLEKFTDFRTYLDFDLLVIDEEGRESRLSRVISKKSGGETQTPFYIAVLASFVQTYRIKRAGYNNTFRLIVFDEAYSKMDHQRIQESIQLIRNLGLQVILAAPTEKTGDIAPFVDRNLLVTRVKDQTIVRAFDPRPEAEAQGA